jgi:hypothetical protein
MIKKIAVIFCVLAFFGLAGCATTGSSNAQTKFEGKWKNYSAPVDLIYLFKGNTWKLTIDKTIRKGVFSFDETYITFIFIDGKYEESWKQTYLIQNDVLKLEQEIDPDPRRRFGHIYGSFKKQ